MALTLFAALFAAGVPALVARTLTSSLQQALTEATPADRAEVATTMYAGNPQPDGPAPKPASLDSTLNAYAAQIPSGTGAEAAQAWDGAHLNVPLPLKAQGQDATIDLEYRSSTSAHLRLLAGVMPATAQQPPDFSSVLMDVALSAATAKRYGAQVEWVLPVVLPTMRYILRVTGIFEPTDPSSEYWYYDAGLSTPSLAHSPTGVHWDTAAMVGPGELSALATVQAANGPGVDQLDFVFCVPMDTSGYRAQNAGALLASLSGFDTGLTPVNLYVESVSGPVAPLTAFQTQRTSIDAILALVMAGVAVIGGVTLLLCAQFVLGRRRGYAALLRARGQSHLQLAARVCLALGLPNLAAVVVVGAALRLVLPGDGTSQGTLLLAGVGVLALLGPPALAVLDLRGRSGVQATTRRDLVRRPRTARRRVLELLVLLLAAGAVVELHRQGVGGAQQGSNALGSLTPILLAALATVVAMRCYPLLLRPAARLADRRGGPVSFLGLAGAARSAFPLAAPAFVITLTLTLAALGGVLNRAVDDGRNLHSWQVVGADAVIALPPDTTWAAAARTVAALEAVPGVTHATAFAGQPDPTTNSDVDVVDPASYAAVSADTPWPLGSAALPATGSAASGPVPVLVEPGSGQAVGSHIEITPTYAKPIEAVVVGYVSQTPADPGGAEGTGFVMVPAWAVAGTAAYWPDTEILVSGQGIDEEKMNAVLAGALPGSSATYRADVLGGYVHAPLAGLAEFGYLTGLLAAGVFGVCAILLALSLTAPARARRLTLLGTLGLTPRQARGIALAETVPLVAATVLAGLLAAAVVPAVFGGALDLSAFTGLPGPSSLGFDPGIVLLAACAAAALTALGGALQAAAARRRDAGAELRMGEDAE